VGDTVGAWLAVLEHGWPVRDALGWDRPGLQVGDPAWPVARTLVALDVTAAVVDEAAAVEGTLLVAHHPLLLRPLTALTPATAAGRLALRAAVARVAVAAAHTNLDAADDGTGTSDPVVAALGLEGVGPLLAPERPGARPLGRVGDLPAPLRLDELARRVAAGLGAPSARVVGPGDREVRRVAVLGGSGADAAGDALAAGADVLVTGDVRHHAALDALAMGLALVDAGHHATEAAAMPAFAARLAEHAAAAGLAAPVVASAVPTDPWTTVQP
jgi:dinuclear metal center YbgI/SA1388 family protein